MCVSMALFVSSQFEPKKGEGCIEWRIFLRPLANLLQMTSWISQLWLRAAISTTTHFIRCVLLVMLEMLVWAALLTWIELKSLARILWAKLTIWSLSFSCSFNPFYTFFWCCACLPIIDVFSVPFRHGERIGFSYLVSQKYAGDSSAIKVLRNSEILNFNIKLASHRRLIPAHNKGRPPSYYIIAGFVFTTVSVPYLRSEVYCLLQI